MTDKAKPAAARWTLPLCFLIAVLEGYDLQVISSAGPFLQREMGLGPHQLGWFFSASLLGLAIGAIGGGWLADRIGRKRVLVWSLVTLGLFTLGSALAHDYALLMVMRMFAGLGLGGAMPTLIAMVTEVSGGAKTTTAVTTMICGQPLGGILSALVGKGLAASYGWEVLFTIGGVATIATIPLVLRVLPETRTTSAHADAARLPAGQALFGEDRARQTALLWAVFIFTLALLSILLSWTPLLVIGKGLPRDVGLSAIIAINLGGIVGGLIASRAIDRLGVRWPMLALYTLMAFAFHRFAGATATTPLLIAAFLVGVGVLGAQFTLYGIAPRIYPLAGRATGVGLAVAMGRIGSVGGPLVIGGLLGQGASAEAAIRVMIPIALAAGVGLLALTLVSGGKLRPQPGT